MQKLKFINSLGEEIDLTSGLSGENYAVINWSGFDNVALEVQNQTVPYQDGSVFLDGILDNREISITIAINDNHNLEKRYKLKRELIHILNPKNGEGVLIYENDFLKKQINVISEVPIFETKNSDTGGTLKGNITFIACNPYWEDVEETLLLVKGQNSINCQNDGDVRTEVNIQYSGDDESFVVKNKTNQNRLGFTSLESGKTITISTDVGNKVVKKLELKSDIKISQNKARCAVFASDSVYFYLDKLCTIVKEDVRTSFSCNVEIDKVWYLPIKNRFFANGTDKKFYFSDDGIKWNYVDDYIAYGVVEHSGNVIRNANYYDIELGEQVYNLSYSEDGGLHFTDSQIEKVNEICTFSDKLVFIDKTDSFYRLNYTYDYIDSTVIYDNFQNINALISDRNRLYFAWSFSGTNSSILVLDEEFNFVGEIGVEYSLGRPLKIINPTNGLIFYTGRSGTIGNVYNSYLNLLYTSNDGSETPPSITDIIFDSYHNIYYVIQSNDRIAISTNSENFELMDTSTVILFASDGFYNYLFDSNNNLLRSQNLQNFEIFEENILIKNMDSFGFEVCGITEDGFIFRIKNQTFEKISFSNVNEIKLIDGEYFISGNFGIKKSSNFSDWVSVFSDSDYIIKSVAKGNGKYFAVGTHYDYNVLILSEDGETWNLSDVENISSYNFIKVVYSEFFNNFVFASDSDEDGYNGFFIYNVIKMNKCFNSEGSAKDVLYVPDMKAYLCKTDENLYLYTTTLGGAINCSGNKICQGLLAPYISGENLAEITLQETDNLISKIDGTLKFYLEVGKNNISLFAKESSTVIIRYKNKFVGV